MIHSFSYFLVLTFKHVFSFVTNVSLQLHYVLFPVPVKVLFDRGGPQSIMHRKNEAEKKLWMAVAVYNCSTWFPACQLSISTDFYFSSWPLNSQCNVFFFFKFTDQYYMPYCSTMTMRNCTSYMNYVCWFQNPNEKDRNSKKCALSGDLKVTWCSSPGLPRKVSPRGKEYWYQWTESIKDALEQNSLPECCSSRIKRGKKNCYTWISLPSVRRCPRKLQIIWIMTK